MNKTLIPLCLLGASAMPAYASWTLDVNLVSNYLFNGVSQTNKNPALQVGLNHDFGNGVYAGLWSSNVDYGEGTKLEFDGYIGYYTEFESGLTLDTALSQYTYHGTGSSSEFNFPEVYLKFGYGNSGLNFWYTWDYFGFGGEHYVIQAAHTLQLNDDWTVFAAVDRSITGDQNAWSWEGKSGFYHGQVMFNTAMAGFNIGVGVHATTLKERWGDTTLLFTIGRTFEF